MIDLSSATLPVNWLEQTLTPAEQSEGVIFKAAHNEPRATLIIRRMAKKLTKDFEIKALPEELVKAFGTKVYSFKLMNKGLAKIGEYKTAKIQYEQLDPRTNKLYENLVITIPMQWQTFHVVYRAKKEDFKASEKDVPKITQSFLKSIFLQ